MVEIWDVYANDIHDNFKTLYGNWPPNVPIKLGDFGTLGHNVFNRKGNVKEVFGITFKERVGSGQKAHYSYKSAESTEVTLKAQGQGGTGGITVNASLEIKFSSKHAVFFNAAGCEHDSIEDEVMLGNDVMRLMEAEKWDDDWVIVTRLIRSGATTIAIAGSQDGSIVFEAEATVPKIDLADAGLKLAVNHERNIGFSVATEGLVPLVGFGGLAVSWWPWGDKRWGTYAMLPKSVTEYDTITLRKMLKDEGKPLSTAFQFGRIISER